MSRAVLVARAQAAAERGMVDSCTIRRRTGEVTAADATVTPTYAVIYSGPCRIQQHRALSGQHDVGEDHQLLVRLELQLPMSATGVEVADEVTIDSSQDADLTGRVLLARDLAHKTDASSRRIGVTERTG